jgi:transcription elongation factor Elf1
VQKTVMVSEVTERVFVIGDRVEKYCLTCGEERGHVISTLTKRGKIGRVTCPKCGTRGSFKSDVPTGQRKQQTTGAPYDRSKIYRTGQSMVHPIFGPGEVMALIEPRKIDVLFADRIRRLVHATRD